MLTFTATGYDRISGSLLEWSSKRSNRSRFGSYFNRIWGYWFWIKLSSHRWWCWKIPGIGVLESGSQRIKCWRPASNPDTIWAERHTPRALRFIRHATRSSPIWCRCSPLWFLDVCWTYKISTYASRLVKFDPLAFTLKKLIPSVEGTYIYDQSPSTLQQCKFPFEWVSMHLPKTNGQNQSEVAFSSNKLSKCSLRTLTALFPESQAKKRVKNGGSLPSLTMYTGTWGESFSWSKSRSTNFCHISWHQIRSILKKEPTW